MRFTVLWLTIFLKYSRVLSCCFLHSDVFGVPAYGKRSLSGFGPFCEWILGEKKNKEKMKHVGLNISK